MDSLSHSKFVSTTEYSLFSLCKPIRNSFMHNFPKMLDSVYICALIYIWKCIQTNDNNNNNNNNNNGIKHNSSFLMFVYRTRTINIFYMYCTIQVKCILLLYCIGLQCSEAIKRHLMDSFEIRFVPVPR